MYLKKGAPAKHKVGTFTSFGELVIIHRFEKGHYIGNFSQPYGMLMVDMRFRKQDCVKVSPKEAKRIFMKVYDEDTYKWWFGREAV